MEDVNDNGLLVSLNGGNCRIRLLITNEILS
jgi:hypothetical protein